MDQPPQLDSLLILSAASIPFAKTLMDVVTANWPNRPQWFPIVGVAIIGPTVVLLLEVYLGVALTGQAIAGCLLGGWSAGGAAIGQTIIGQKATEARKEATGSSQDHF